MITIDSARRFRLPLAIGALLLLSFQSGCNEQAPATESDQRITAQEKRAASLKGELDGLQRRARSARAH